MHLICHLYLDAISFGLILYERNSKYWINSKEALYTFRSKKEVSHTPLSILSNVLSILLSVIRQQHIELETLIVSTNSKEIYKKKDANIEEIQYYQLLAKQFTKIKIEFWNEEHTCNKYFEMLKQLPAA